MRVTILLGIVILLLTFIVRGNFFGPDNYGECVLDKMKGQNEEMIFTANQLCEKKFPYEKALGNYTDEIEISWYTDQNSLNLSIIENYGEYEITRYKASFSEKKCEDVKSPDDYTLEATFKFKKGTKSASISLKNSNKYQCMRTERMWGKKG
jgi:hypothetical protein